MLLPKKSYVIQSNQNRKFEFEFNDLTQHHFYRTLKSAKEGLEDLKEEFKDDLDVISFKIYEVNLTLVK